MVAFIVLKQFPFREGVLITFVGLSSTAFLINFVMNLWAALRMIRGAKKISPSREPETKELSPAGQNVQLGPAPASVTENTTRSFEPVLNKRN